MADSGGSSSRVENRGGLLIRVKRRPQTTSFYVYRDVRRVVWLKLGLVGKTTCRFPSEGQKRQVVLGGRKIKKKKKKKEEGVFWARGACVGPFFPLLPLIAYSINFHDNFAKF